jgi:cbb3-type cytochrome oxidase subunit 3
VKQTVIILLLLSYTTLCHAYNYQTKNNRHNVPDLSGTWELDKSRSRLSKDNPVLRGGTITLTITHNEPQIGILQKINADGKEKTKEFLYYTDGRGEVNPANYLYLSLYNGKENSSSTSPRKIESRSQWKGANLKTKYNIPIQIPGWRRMTKLEVEEEWTLSSDSKTLTHTTSFKGLRDGALQMQVEPGKLLAVYNKT